MPVNLKQLKRNILKVSRDNPDLVNVNLYLCLTKYQAIKKYPDLN